LFVTEGSLVWWVILIVSAEFVAWQYLQARKIIVHIFAFQKLEDFSPTIFFVLNKLYSTSKAVHLP